MAREKTSAVEVIALLDSLTIEDLEKVLAAAERQRDAKRESGKKELMEEFRVRAEALGLSLSELARRSGITVHNVHQLIDALVADGPAEGVQTLVTDVSLGTPEDRRRVAEEVLSFAATLER